MFRGGVFSRHGVFMGALMSHPAKLSSSCLSSFLCGNMGCCKNWTIWAWAECGYATIKTSSGTNALFWNREPCSNERLIANYPCSLLSNCDNI